MRPVPPRARVVLIVVFGALGVWNLVEFSRGAWASGRFAPGAGDWFDLMVGLLELAFVASLALQWRRGRSGH